MSGRPTNGSKRLPIAVVDSGCRAHAVAARSVNAAFPPLRLFAPGNDPGCKVGLQRRIETDEVPPRPVPPSPRQTGLPGVLPRSPPFLLAGIVAAQKWLEEFLRRYRALDQPRTHYLYGRPCPPGTDGSRQTALGAIRTLSAKQRDPVGHDATKRR